MRLGVTGALAYVSYRVVEEPIRTQRLQRWFTPTQWARAVAVTTVGVVAATLFATASAQPVGEAPQAAGGRPAPVPDSQGRLLDVFLLGDSQAFGLRNLYGNRVDGLAVSGSTQLGCGTLLAERQTDGQTVPNLPACAEWEPRWTQEVAREKPDLVVLMLGLGELYDRRVDGRVLRFGTPEYREWLYREMDRRRELVAPSARHFAVATVLCMGISADAANQTTRIANDPERLRWLNDVHPLVRQRAARGRRDRPARHGVCRRLHERRSTGSPCATTASTSTSRAPPSCWERIGPAVIVAAE